MTPFTRSRVLLAVVLSLLLLVGACGKDDPTTEAGPDDSAPAADRAAVEKAVRDSLKAENAKDAKAFLALWTDKGLESYDVGSRADLEAGKAEGFGEEPIELLKFTKTEVTGTTARTTAQAMREENQVAKPLFQATFSLLKKGEQWLLDGFEYQGGPPPSRGEQVVAVKAQEYGFAMETELPGNVAFTFTNAGKEQHEMTLFKAPGPVSIGDAKKALENVDGSGEMVDDLPAGYAADHITFAEAGQTQNVTFAEPLAAGTYVVACYIPQGGFGENGPVDPDGKPHIQLGMINVLTVT
ncbi:MAG TPA: hypothetical protein VM030_10165 [Acidimicrobiales bacterium]|nr:hypothetical protein [Acidimicrobiales bacterium]